MKSETRVTVVKDMAVTHPEFLRNIARLLPDDGATRDLASHRSVLRLPWGSGVVEVGLEPESVRRLGMMTIPRTRVVLTFTNITPGEREAFIRQFDRRFQRGGG